MSDWMAAVGEAMSLVKRSFSGGGAHDMPLTPVELLLNEHLPLDCQESFFGTTPSNASISAKVMLELSSRSHNVVDFRFIMERIWEVLMHQQEEVHQMKKALSVLLHLLVNGDIRVVRQCQETEQKQFLEALSTDYNRLENEKYKYSKDLDIGAVVRKLAGDVYYLITHEEELQEQRNKAKQVHEKLANAGLRTASERYVPGVRTPPLASLSSASFTSYDQWNRNEKRPSAYTDSYPAGSAWDDGLAGKIITHTSLDEKEISSSPTATNPRGESRKSKRNSSTKKAPSSPPMDLIDLSSPPRQSSNSTESVDLLGLGPLMPAPPPPPPPSAPRTLAAAIPASESTSRAAKPRGTAQRYVATI